jgi:hypothetical protein
MDKIAEAEGRKRPLEDVVLLAGAADVDGELTSP